MSRRRVERLLNLTMCLMATSRFLTVAEIGDLVDGYEPGRTEDEQDAFRRMFERDKVYLREIGIPLETGSESAFSDEVGYRIRRGDYALPDIALAADEAAALALAGSLWSSTALAGPAASALRKLAAGGAPLSTGGLGAPDGFEPRMDATDPAFEPCLAAVQTGRAIRFPYRKVGAAQIAERQVEPWGVLSWRGRWYLAGHDRDRDAPRVFRLSRFTGPVRLVGPAGAVTVPPGVDLRAMVTADAPPERTRTATLAVRRGAAHALRRYARTAARADPSDAAATRSGSAWPGGLDPRGFDLLEIDFSDADRLARWIVGSGPDVIVVAPADLRAGVIRRLRAALEGAPAPATPPNLSTAAPTPPGRPTAVPATGPEATGRAVGAATGDRGPAVTGAGEPR